VSALHRPSPAVCDEDEDEDEFEARRRASAPSSLTAAGELDGAIVGAVNSSNRSLGLEDATDSPSAGGIISGVGLR